VTHTRSVPEPATERHHDVARLEAFSDGVFAFAATLLALGIRIARPDDADASVGLYQLVLAQWPSYVAYALSFITVGIVWANHHVMFSYFVRTDRALVFLNLLMLMLVAFLPVPTGVLGAWLANDSGRLVAVLFYAGTLVAFGIVHDTTWWYAAYRAHATTPQLSDREPRALTLTWLPGPMLYSLAIAIAFVDARYSIVLFALIHVLYVLPIPRLLGAARRARRRSG